MNKIYKVIWSKVKHQYVVVSELAHSNGKQSRTSRNSIRSRIAALVVCGAIAAFGFLGTSDVYAGTGDGATATTSQYVAIGSANYTDAENCKWNSWFGNKYPETYDPNKEYYQMIDGHKYVYTQTTAGNFWVRDGYTIKINKDQRFPGTYGGTATVVETYKGEGADTKGILQSYQNVEKSMGITTLNKDTLYSTKTDMYVGAVNTPTTEIKSSKNRFYILRNGSWVNVGLDGSSSFSSNFNYTDVKYDKSTGLYTFHGEVVPTENLYVIDGNVGVFTTKAGGTEIYKGDVYGWNNEILVTGVDEEGKYTSYWGSENVDPNAPIGNMPISTLERKFDVVNNSIRDVAGDNIKEIQVAKAEETDGTKGGTIGLQTNGDYYDTGEKDENGNPIYAPMGGANVPGAITITSEGGTGGDDVRIKFANEKGSFTVDAGSKVVANNGAGGTDLESISVNGQTFNVVGGAIAGQIDSEGNVKIQQGNKEPVTIGKVSDWNVKSGQINGSTLTLNTENAYDGNPKTGTVTIEGVASTNYVDGKDALNVKYDSTDKTSITLGKDGNKTQIHNVAAGTDDYDAVNFKQLQDVAGAEDYVKEGTINTSTGVIKLTRQLGGEITINGLQDYVNGKDSYVTDAKLNGNTLTITQNNQGKPFNIDLSGLTSGLSSSDYQVVANPNSINGEYSVSEDGKVELTVQNGTNEEDRRTVTISDVASTGALNNATNTLNQKIDNQYTTVTNEYKTYVDGKDALNEKYDSTDKTSVTLGGSDSDPVKLTNVADGTIEKDSKDAVNAGQLYDVNQKVDAGWTATDGTNDIKVNPKDGTTTLKFAGDNNIAVTADTTNKAIQVALNDKVYLGGDHTEDSRNIVLDGERGVIGLGSTIALDGRDGTAVIGGVNITTTAEEGTGKLVSTINGLSNTTWTGTTETPNRAATEGQLQSVATEAAKHTTVSGDENITVKHEEGSQDYQVTLNPDVTLKGDNSSIELNGTKGTMQVNQETTEGTDFTNINGNVVSIGYTNKEGTKNAIVIDGGEGTITGLSNTTWDGSTNDISRAATEGQLKAVSDTVNAGWIATDNSGKEVAVNPDNNKLKFAGDDNITVSATTDENNNNAINVKLNDNITLGNGQSAITLNGSPENSNDPALSVGTDKFVVDQDGSLSVSDKFNVDAETGNIYAANNSGSAIVMNDDSVAFSADGNGVVASDEGILLNTNGLDKDIRLVTKGTIVSVDKDGATFTNTNTNETTNIDGGTINVGDKLVVDQDGTTTIAVNDGTVMGNNTTMTVNKDGVAFSAYGNGTTVIDGQTIYAGGVVINNNGSGTINGLTNTTWDDELAKQVANSEELQGTAATQGQLQQAVNEVAEVANAGWNAKAGGNTINVKPNETLNFEGDGNITVSATGGTSNELKFGLNDNITLGDKTSTSITLYTDPKSETTVVGTDGKEVNVTGYVPESYKSETGADFVKNNGGFALFTTDTQGHGIFGVTTKGTAHGKDFVTYTKDIYGNDTQYSLNDVGNIVTQISHAVFNEGEDSTGMEYTLISDFEDEADKDSPFEADEGKTRTIGLAVRQDSAVIVGAVVNENGEINDSGIRINAEKRVNKDGTTSSDNMATITGLENTTWTPPEPEQSQIATFADDTPKTSRAATEAQLDDLYSSVVGYNVENGSVNTRHITLGGMDPNNAYDSKTYKGGVILDNVAYASGTDGSEAVNVDYLNDAINNAVKDGGAISDSDRHLQEGTYHVNDQGKVELIVADEKGENQSTVTIDNIANKNDITNLDNKIDNTFNDLNDKINNIDNVETDVKGGNINEDGTISLKTENEDGTTTNVTLKGQLTDSGVVQEGTSFDKETGTITITSQDKYSGETSSVKVEGIASTDVVGVTTKEELADKYKAADEDGNATTAYITESESMVEADVALDHAIQDVANTGYANDMVLSNRIDSVEKRLGNVEERIDKVGAMAAAIANLRTMGFDPEAPTEIAIGVGQYKSETGIAIGVFHYPNQDFMLSASLSSSGDELMGGIGATWKLGRKSAAERAKDEEARHLEQAEEMKKLAQQEKVKAQAQRHAKLLAERQQASQKNA